MALFGGARDVSMFRGISRELMWDIIVQECALYKFRLEETNVNIYGEVAEEKYYMGPVLFNVLIERNDQDYPETDLGTDFTWGVNFKFLRDDMVDAEVVPEVGDVILYEEGYYEVDSIVSNQLFVGKDPKYPNAPNPIETDLANFGYDVSFICKTHYVPADKLGITRERLV